MAAETVNQEPRYRAARRDPARDRRMTKLQAPISQTKYCVMYLKEGHQHRTAWLYREEHARHALRLMRAKYGDKNAILYRD